MRSQPPHEAPTVRARPSGPTFTETARRRQLLDAAVDAVTELGYHRASLAEIAKRAAIAKSAVVYYFTAKEALLLELVDSVFTALGDDLVSAVAGMSGPTDRLRAYAEAYLAHVDAHRRRIAAAVEIVVSHRLADGRPLYLVEADDDTALLRGILAQGMEDGAFRRLPLDVAVGLAESVLDRAITVVQRDPDADLRDLRRHALPFLLRAFAVGEDDIGEGP
ncbi:TetR/AcrR family transcriptional regulator [Streptomyces sp. MS2A]|nr:TetR/AcrR family transcriptional regulator [Streptomyces sp. MS2A]